MIISCEKCTKKFNIRDELIPENGRLLQCGNCNHKWFYKLPTQNVNLENDNSNVLPNNDTLTEEKKKIIEKVIKSSLNQIEKKEKKIINKTIKKAKYGTNIVKRFIVLII